MSLCFFYHGQSGRLSTSFHMDNRVMYLLLLQRTISLLLLPWTVRSSVYVYRERRGRVSMSVYEGRSVGLPSGHLAPTEPRDPADCFIADICGSCTELSCQDIYLCCGLLPLHTPVPNNNQKKKKKKNRLFMALHLVKEEIEDECLT